MSGVRVSRCMVYIRKRISALQEDGFSHGEISKSLGISKHTVARIARDIRSEKSKISLPQGLR